ncbi:MULTISPECIES: hypothetical protein [Pseudomonas]|uniref:Uncharacterized protein n=1 Tax=Pseudomonas wuhanensis TaxID=2954098 RepID=A0ABY9GXX6_9PSED|nr:MULTISPECIES: hypothetical protein [unclassified Pseudomonas]WLI14431.1 hypothetical protein PSH65_10030 [Pseudomonas sp. FP603]WLI20347.1 hypothetical protein PSH88_10050 [Pseudomonas sp. FP607]
MIDFDAVQRLNVQDGDLLVVPEDSDPHDMELLCDALHIQMPGRKVIIIRGPVQQLEVDAMNKLGWYRA